VQHAHHNECNPVTPVTPGPSVAGVAEPKLLVSSGAADLNLVRGGGELDHVVGHLWFPLVSLVGGAGRAAQ
jgi:hypothetical protein